MGALQASSNSEQQIHEKTFKKSKSRNCNRVLNSICFYRGEIFHKRISCIPLYYHLARIIERTNRNDFVRIQMGLSR